MRRLLSVMYYLAFLAFLVVCCGIQILPTTAQQNPKLFSNKVKSHSSPDKIGGPANQGKKSWMDEIPGKKVACSDCIWETTAGSMGAVEAGEVRAYSGKLVLKTVALAASIASMGGGLGLLSGLLGGGGGGSLAFATGGILPELAGLSTAGAGAALFGGGGLGLSLSLDMDPTQSSFTRNEEMFGSRGPQISSKTVWKGKGGRRIDIENPNPGQRPG